MNKYIIIIIRPGPKLKMCTIQFGLYILNFTGQTKIQQANSAFPSQILFFSAANIFYFTCGCKVHFTNYVIIMGRRIKEIMTRECLTIIKKPIAGGLATIYETSQWYFGNHRFLKIFCSYIEKKNVEQLLWF